MFAFNDIISYIENYFSTQNNINNKESSSMTFQFTLQILKQIAPYGKDSIKESLVEPLNKWLPQYEINTLLRLQNFIGQSAEETDSFNTLEEYASGQEYEGRKDLGNIYPGDGKRYKGRGVFQLTGRANYETYGRILKIDLINNPELAATSDIAIQTACEYWKTHELNKFADENNIEMITRRINGGLNGFIQRKIYTNKAHTYILPFFK